jgi:hypothetical protein
LGWVTLTGGGSVTFQTTIPAVGPNSALGPTPIRINYHGDTVYAASGAYFPMSNPAPSTSASSPPADPAAATQPTGPDPAASSGTPVAEATTGTSVSEATAGTQTPEAAATQPPGPVAGAVQPVRLVASPGAGRYWAGAIAFVTLIGLGGGLFWWRRRRLAGSPPEADA